LKTISTEPGKMSAAPTPFGRRVKMNEIKLKRESLPYAAAALSYQAMVRAVASHEKETLLVYATNKRESFAVPSASRGRFADHLGTSFEATSVTSQPSSLLDQAQVYSATTNPAATFPHPTSVVSIPGTDYRTLLPRMMMAKCKEARPAQYSLAGNKAQKILKAQNPTAVTEFQVGGTDSTELLPGGLPVLDHAIASLTNLPGWKKTAEVLKSFAQIRLTLPDALPEIREITIGRSSSKEYRDAGAWIDQKHQENREKYGFCFPALDVECVAMVIESCPADWDNIAMEIDFSEQLEAKIIGPELEGASRFHFPVLLMYGGIGWQLHVRLPCAYIKRDKTTYIRIPETFGSAVEDRGAVLPLPPCHRCGGERRHRAVHQGS